MSKPIKVTPVLKGKDAINFLIELENNRNRKIDPDRLAEIKRNAQLLKSILKTN